MNRHITKKIYKGQISTLKDAQHHWSPEKHKLKPQWDTSTHQLEWLKLERLIILSVDGTEEGTETLIH